MTNKEKMIVIFKWYLGNNNLYFLLLRTPKFWDFHIDSSDIQSIKNYFIEKLCLLLKIYHFRNLEIISYLEHKTLLRTFLYKKTFAPNILKLNITESTTKNIFLHLIFCRFIL